MKKFAILMGLALITMLFIGTVPAMAGGHGHGHHGDPCGPGMCAPDVDVTSVMVGSFGSAQVTNITAGWGADVDTTTLGFNNSLTTQVVNATVYKSDVDVFELAACNRGFAQIANVYASQAYVTIGMTGIANTRSAQVVNVSAYK